MVAIDLNSDLGESFGVWRLGDDEAMLELVTSANVACGFHAGDPSTLRRVCDAAVHNGVAIGAQVSYPDLLGFGRRFIDIDPGELRDAVLYQLGALDAFAQVAGAEVAYVKPHGALYHATIDGAAQADAVVAAAAEYDPSLAVLGAPGSCLLRGGRSGRAGAGRRGVRRPGLPPRRPARAAVGARRPGGRRRPRSRPARCVWPPSTRCASVDGTIVKVAVRSLCLHGDTPGAVDLARAVRDALDAAGVGVHPFTA